MLSDIFQFCHSLLLPEENVLPGSWKEAKKILSSIGMEYQIVYFFCERERRNKKILDIQQNYHSLGSSLTY
jgi:hypothetical protein